MGIPSAATGHSVQGVFHHGSPPRIPSSYGWDRTISCNNSLSAVGWIAVTARDCARRAESVTMMSEVAVEIDESGSDKLGAGAGAGARTTVCTAVVGMSRGGGWGDGG